MKSTEIIARLAAQTGALRARGATALYIFGSRARGDNGPDSDLDVLVDYDRGRKFSLIDLAGIKNAIERELGIEADVATRKALHPQLRDRIEREAIKVL
jgi:uncharacterized protein